MGACPSTASRVALEKTAEVSLITPSWEKADLRGNDGGHRQAPGNCLPHPEETMTFGTKMGGGGWNEEGQVADSFKAYWSKADKAITWKGGAKPAEHTEL